jgi:hypothetical protein
MLVSFLLAAPAAAEITSFDYLQMINWVSDIGVPIIINGNKCNVATFNTYPTEDTRLSVKFTYCYPPWSGVNIRVSTLTYFPDGRREIAVLYMDDADIDRKTNSTIKYSATMVDGIITNYNIEPVHQATAIWESWLEYVYKQYKQFEGE